jgi:hypothetical protein
MYVPLNPINTTVKQYDVNALYPSAMLTNKYPTKLLSYFIGDISNKHDYKHLSPLINKNLTGFFKVKVQAPSITHPLLPYKMNNTTVFGQGSWEGWYYSEEIKNAINFGYEIEILAGYIFESADLFSNYVEAMNKMKVEAEKDSPNYLIAKLLLNSLYGRFGMKPSLNNHKIIDKDLLSNLISSDSLHLENIDTVTYLGEKAMVTYLNEYTKTSNTNIAIALGVAANARVDMSLFKKILISLGNYIIWILIQSFVNKNYLRI